MAFTERSTARMQPVTSRSATARPAAPGPHPISSTRESGCNGKAFTTAARRGDRPAATIGDYWSGRRSGTSLCGRSRSRNLIGTEPDGARIAPSWAPLGASETCGLPPRKGYTPERAPALGPPAGRAARPAPSQTPRCRRRPHTALARPRARAPGRRQALPGSRRPRTRETSRDLKAASGWPTGGVVKSDHADRAHDAAEPGGRHPFHVGPQPRDGGDRSVEERAATRVTVSRGWARRPRRPTWFLDLVVVDVSSSRVRPLG